MGRLRKPTVAAWAVNQLSRERPDELRALLRAGERLARAQVSSNEGSARTLEEAGGAQREAMHALLDAAREVLREAGEPASDATLEKV